MNNTLRSKIIKFIKKNESISFRLQLFRMRIAKIFTIFLKDESYIKKQYRRRTGHKLNLANPVYYNEKIQWIKLNYRNPILNKMVDKYTVREYIKNTIGDKYLIPIYGIYNNVDDIDFDSLPNKFVIKLTNGSGFNYICTNKNKKEIKKIKKRFKRWLNIDFYALGREWAYKDVPNRIICEKFIEDKSYTGLKDYKFFCFNGKAKIIQVDFNRFTNHKRNIYTTNWELIPVSIEYNFDENLHINKPEKLEEMIKLAEILSKGFPHVRVDFYYVDNKIYFGELTFYHEAGYAKFNPRNFEKRLGDWIDLSLFE